MCAQERVCEEQEAFAAAAHHDAQVPQEPGPHAPLGPGQQEQEQEMQSPPLSDSISAAQ